MIVLIVDDSPPDAALIKAMLDRNPEAHVETMVARSLHEAIATVRQQPADCILLDLHLPDGEGPEVVRRMVDAAPDSAVVVLTGARDRAATDAIGLGAQDFLAKDRIDVDVLWRAVRYAVDRHRTQQGILISERRHRSLLDAIAEAVILYDIDGDGRVRAVLANPAAEALLGVSRAELYLNGAADRDYEVVDDQGRPLAPDAYPVAVVGRNGQAVEDAVVGLARRGQPTTWLRTTCRPIHGEDGAMTGVVTSMTDVTAERSATRQLAHQATHDVLTQLPNRALLLDRLGEALERTQHQASGCAVLYIDLDDFKTVNDSLGHAAGDQFLIAVAARLQAAVRAGDTVGRLGGDEFVILLDHVHDRTVVLEIAERVRTSILEPVRIHDHEVTVGASIGIAMGAGHNADVLLQEADTALYRAKQGGRNRWEIYHQDMRSGARQRLETEGRLRRAIEEGDAFPYYQPIVTVATGEVRGAEALARLRGHDGKVLGADAFITVAEDSGLIVPLGLRILDQACAALASWDAGGPWGGAQVAVNVSARQLADPAFVDHVSEVIGRHDVAPGRLCLELTETTLIDSGTSVRRTLDVFHEMGIAIALDDFGTGWSSLAYLRRFPVDTVKIDRSFVGGMIHLQEDAEVVRAVIGLCHALGLVVVAEGVEEEAQAAALAELGCDYAQGYLYGRPVPVA